MSKLLRMAYITEVMDTIATLQDPNGSPLGKILKFMEVHRKKPLRNASAAIQKAIKTGLKQGLIEENKGKFKLTVEPLDYNTYRKHENKILQNLPVKEHRRRKGRRRSRSRSKRRRSRRRRRSEFLTLEAKKTDDESDDDYIYKAFKNNTNSAKFPVKMLRGRRRGKSRRRRSRSRRRRGRRRADLDDISEMENDDDSSEPIDRSRRRRGSRRKKGRRRRGRRRPLDAAKEPSGTSSEDVKFSDEKAKKTKSRLNLGTGKTEPEKPENASLPEPLRSSHIEYPPEPTHSSPCLHEHIYYNDDPYAHHPPPGSHFGDQYY